MFFLPNDKEGDGEESLVFHDWSVVSTYCYQTLRLTLLAKPGPGEPTTDLAQTLISDVRPEIFLKHAEELVKFYWTRLIQLGVSEADYPWKTCWSAFCRGGPERWLWGLTILGSMAELPDNAIQYFHDQTLAFIEEFGDQPYYILKDGYFGVTY